MQVQHHPGPPTRGLEQRMEALERANVVRVYRKNVKVDLKAGRVTFAQLLTRDHPHERTWKVYDVLLALPRHGRVKANTVLRRARISPSKTIGGLSDRQRGELVQMTGAPANIDNEETAHAA
jgi:hypothetical protein